MLLAELLPLNRAASTPRVRIVPSSTRATASGLRLLLMRVVRMACVAPEVRVVAEVDGEGISAAVVSRFGLRGVFAAAVAVVGRWECLSELAKRDSVFQ